ncbi:MAG: hypothetical protein RLZZ144_958 [Pseudomonadota bacterium]|jgi:hypothetical protein
MEHQASGAEISRAKRLHSILLFDFIVVHVFVFVIALGMTKTSLIPLMCFPLISITLLTFVLFQAKKTAKDASWFVRCHAMLAAKRARLFMTLFIVTGSFTAVMYFGGAQFGMSKITSMSLAFGLGQLPFMVALLALVVLEFDAEHQCKDGKIPKSAQSLSAKDVE